MAFHQKIFLWNILKGYFGRYKMLPIMRGMYLSDMYELYSKYWCMQHCKMYLFTVITCDENGWIKTLHCLVASMMKTEAVSTSCPLLHGLLWCPKASPPHKTINYFFSLLFWTLQTTDVPAKVSAVLPSERPHQSPPRG